MFIGEIVMKIIEILSLESIAIGLKADNKDNLIELMVDLAEKSGKIPNKAAVLKSVREREKIMSTGIGKNVGLPHAKNNSIESPVGALALLNPPIDFDSLDGQPVQICFMLLGKDNNVGVHLRLLSKISRYLNNDEFRERLLKAEKPSDVLAMLNEIEE